MFEQLLSRTDAVYQRWLASINDDVLAGAVAVYCLESLPERHTTYGIGEWLPGYIMIGQEGDRGMFLKRDGGGGPMFLADLGSRGEADLHMLAPAFETWLRASTPVSGRRPHPHIGFSSVSAGSFIGPARHIRRVAPARPAMRSLGGRSGCQDRGSGMVGCRLGAGS